MLHVVYIYGNVCITALMEILDMLHSVNSGRFFINIPLTILFPFIFQSKT